MLKQKRAKPTRLRGSSSHGWGHKKKHRGAGARGGKGLSGTGARGDAQKAGLLSGSKKFYNKIAAAKGVPLKKFMTHYTHFGKKGFKSIHAKKVNTLSLNYIENNFDKMVEGGIIVKEKNEYIFDATAFSYDKILGKSNFTKKLTVVTKEISESAKQKIIDAGGKVEVTSAKEDEFVEDSSEK